MTAPRYHIRLVFKYGFLVTIIHKGFLAALSYIQQSSHQDPGNLSKERDQAMFFKNRQDAGHQLGQELLKTYHDKDIVVYALPRGGVPVAAEISKLLQAPLDLIFAHKIGHPYEPEYAIAAVSECGHLIGPPADVVPLIDPEWFEWEKEHQINEIKRKHEQYMKDRDTISVENKIAILVDDGIATGLTMEVGIKELKGRHPSNIVVAVPVSPKSISRFIKTLVDDFVGIEVEDHLFLGAIGAYYQEFKQVEDYEVIQLLKSQE